MGVPKVIVPYVPGITCALGCIVADVRHDFVQTVSKAVDQLDEKTIAAILKEHRAAGEKILKDENVPVDRVEVFHEADMQYEGQTYTLRVVLDADQLSVADLSRKLRQEYLDKFRIDLGAFRAKLINLRTSVTGIRPHLDLKKIVRAAKGSAKDAEIGKRDVWFTDSWVSTPIYDRNALPVGAKVSGPAIFNQMDTTTVIEPGDVATVDDFGNLIVEIK